MTRLSAVHTQLYKTIFTILLAMVSACAFSSPVISDADRDIARQAKELRKQKFEVPVNIHSSDAQKEAMSVFNEIRENVISDIVQQAPVRPTMDGKILVFASFSLGEEQLREMSELMSHADQSIMLFQGLINEDDLPGSMNKIRSLAVHGEQVTNINLDPTLFQKYNITHVPAMIAVGEGGEALTKVSGLADPAWLLRKLKDEDLGDHGVKGPVEPISERNIIEVLQDKVAGIDWAQKKEDAVKRFWEKQDFLNLPPASEASVRRLDPTIVITKDMVTPDGQIIHRLGTRINPLHIKSFDQALVVFDPLDNRQLAAVDERLLKLKKKYNRITLIVTQFDRAEGWDSYKSISDHFDAPVFKLTPDILSRFELKTVPSVVTALNEHFVIEELALEVEE